MTTSCEEKLTVEQKAVVDKIISLNKNVFITGSAGVGKSFLLKFLINLLKEKYPASGKIVVTASTGIAATHINGQTIHSFAGIGLGTGNAIDLFEQLTKTEILRWKNVQCLVIDEISMLDGATFEKLNFIAKMTRENNEPFGGIQLVISGDFYQLPPVQREKKHSNLFAFESLAWNEAGILFTELHQVMRQAGSENQTFVQILNDIRKGQFSLKSVEEINKCHINQKPIPSDGILPTKLYCTNRDVDEENKKHLWRLPGKQVDITAIDLWGGKINAGKQQELLSLMDKKLARVIKLRKGAQVILVRNMSALGLVNGSRGVVENFEVVKNYIDHTTSIIPVVRFDNGMIVSVLYIDEMYTIGKMYLTRKQVPLKLAWALTVHKSQGMTVSRVELSLANAFDYGQVYVALSRVSSIKGLYLSNYIYPKNIKVHPYVRDYYSSNESFQSNGNNTSIVPDDDPYLTPDEAQVNNDSQETEEEELQTIVSNGSDESESEENLSSFFLDDQEYSVEEETPDEEEVQTIGSDGFEEEETFEEEELQTIGSDGFDEEEIPNAQEYSAEEETPEADLETITETSYSAENENDEDFQKDNFCKFAKDDQSGIFDEEERIIICRRQNNKRKRILDDEEDFEL